MKPKRSLRDSFFQTKGLRSLLAPLAGPCPRQKPQRTLLTHGLRVFQELKTCVLVFELFLLKRKPKTLFFALMNYSSFARRPQLLFYFQLSFSITPFRNKNGKHYLASRKKYVHTFKKQFHATLIT